MILLILTLISIFCGISLFCMGFNAGREMQQKEDEKQNEILKEIRNKGYNVNT